ncbi:MAG: DnaT-like ssDNA-binding protein [Caulobacter sp.]
MALVVTPGAADADAFVSLEDCADYCEARGLTAWTDEPDSPATAKEAAIRRATAYLSTAFAWKGTKTSGRSQALAWPRTDVEDAEGEIVPDDEIPTEIVQACCEVAVLELTTPGYTAPNVVLTDRVKAERVGPLSVEYATAPMSAQAARPVMLIVGQLVAGLVATSSNALAGSSIRA